MKTAYKTTPSLQLTLSIEETRLLYTFMNSALASLGFEYHPEPEILDFWDELGDAIANFWQKAEYTLSD